ncbi:MAG TPA: prepilin-type N-terminal cleavage/methylation domain-containing protein [Gemmatimonadales bacterium]|jgi:prepilin-type N-terminal cleavage/methylation domain-containing protein|nr:prepilin-type N-terminal cleavage/methylation domain-containing protein [Gemmatimonadales bacterium]
MKPVRAGTRGLTILELLIAMVIGLVLLTGVYGVLINQSREYLVHRENVDVTETLRGAAVLLTSEIEHSAAVRDLVTIGASTLKLRSIQNAGVFCVDATPRYGVWLPSGLFGSGTDDSAFVRRVTDGAWVHTKVTQVWVNPGGGAPAATACPVAKWAGGGTPPRVVQLAYNPVGDSLGVRVGSAIRGFRMTTYSLTSSGGRWWLGRQIGAGTVDLITGPLQAGGLTFEYFDADGVVTATPANVVSIKVTLRAESFRKVRQLGGDLDNRFDDVSFTAYLRN